MTKETPGSILAKLITQKTEGASDEELKKTRQKLEEKTVQYFGEHRVECTISSGDE